MPLTYEIFMKHADKVCKHAGEITTRKVLQGVMHYSDGSAAVTDSHRLYMVKSIHNLEEDTINTPAGEKIEDRYPEVRRLIPQQDGELAVKVSVPDMLQAADIIASVGSQVEKLPLMKLKDETASFDHYEMVINYSFPGFSFGKAPVWINAKYVLDAMNLFKAAGCEMVKLHFYGRTRPLVMFNEDETLLALILPVRKY